MNEANPIDYAYPAPRRWPYWIALALAFCAGHEISRHYLLPAVEARAAREVLRNAATLDCT